MPAHPVPGLPEATYPLTLFLLFQLLESAPLNRPQKQMWSLIVGSPRNERKEDGMENSLLSAMCGCFYASVPVTIMSKLKPLYPVTPEGMVSVQVTANT